MAGQNKFVTKHGLATNNISFVDEIGNPTNTMTASMTSNETLSFDGQTQQLFSITDYTVNSSIFVDTSYGTEYSHIQVGGKISATRFTGELDYNDITNPPSLSDFGGLGANEKAVDSDLLDGLDSTQFLRSDQDDTHSGVITFNAIDGGLRFTTGNDAAGIKWVNDETGNAGALEFWTSDDRSEPFIFRSYDSGLTGTGTSEEWFRITTNNAYFKNNGVWHAGNDGPGSGLDADTVDGKQLNELIQTSGSSQTITSSVDNNNNNSPSSSGFAFTVRAGTAEVGLGQNNGDASIQAYGTGTGYNLHLNPVAGQVIVGGRLRSADIITSGSIGVGITPGPSLNNGAGIALGDNDTGIRQNGDGIFEIFSNNQVIAEVITSSFNVLKPLVVNTSDDGSNTLQVGGDARVTGNAGFGTSSPSEKVDVAGNARIRNENALIFGGSGVGDGEFSMQFNSATKSLDFNFIGA